MGTKSSRSIVGGLLALLAAATFGPGFAQDGERVADASWPREIETSNARITVYEPQLESLKGSRLTSRCAISIVTEENPAPVFGGLRLETDLEIDASRRTATPSRVTVTEIRFPSLDVFEGGEWRSTIASEVLRWSLTFSLDRLLSDLKVLEERKATARGLKADVPEILFRQHSAVLLAIDGEPAWRTLPDTSFRRIANSAFFLVQDGESGMCFLRISPYWWIAKSPLGPWLPVDHAPADVAELWKNEPQPQLPPEEPGQDAPPRPEVIPATQPSELIWTDGRPEYAPIPGTDLLYVRNTESDVFLEIRTQKSYVLLSGRWYRTDADRVAWEFVPSDLLPTDFGRIPLSSEKRHVLACVAGTSQAREAVENAEIPQTEAVKPGPAPDLAVTYDGEPQYVEAGDGVVQYAVNSPYAVFHVYGRYYCCEDGIWYEGAGSWGPWFVCSWVPPSIYLIPPSCPYYYVTYCRIFSVTPDAVYCGYYPGYRGCYVWGGTVVYGTGWRYRCWSGRVWCPRPVTWGVGVRYHAPSCSWTVRVGGEATCAWTGVRRVSSYRSSSAVAGAGGWWTGVGYRRGDPGPRRNVQAPPSTPHQAPNLYRGHPDRIVPARPLPPPRATPPSPVPPARTPPGYGRHPSPPGHPDGPSAPPGHGESPRPPAAPPSAGHDGPERPKSPPPSAPREIPRPSPAPPAPRETPKPPSRDPRETPPSSPPPPRDHREAPKSPPPPPPPRERREAPPSPPPAPPPREHREAPRNPPPPPPPPPREHREAPKSPPPPPPPPREHRDPPRQPPREQDSSKDRGRR